jgi:hypothetical protein
LLSALRQFLAGSHPLDDPLFAKQLRKGGMNFLPTRKTKDEALVFELIIAMTT